MGEIATKFKSKSSEVRRLYLKTFPERMLTEKKADQYYNTLMDFDFISLKIQHPDFGVESLIMDYDLIDDLKNSCRLKPEEITNLELVRGALLLSSHILKQHTNQLAAQLWGTLQCFPQQPIQNLLKSASESHNVWLRPITASLRNGNLLANFPGHEKWVNSVSITEDGKKAVSGASDNSLKLWDLQSGKIIHNWENDDGITAVAITPDGKTVISGSRNKTLKLWNAETGKPVLSLEGHDSWVTAVAITPDGKMAISGSDDRILKFWHLDLDNKKATCIHTLKGHKDAVRAVAITPNGKIAISGSRDNNLKLWNLQNGEEIRTLEGHEDWVRAVAITSNGKKAISGSLDHTIKLWNLQTGEVIRTLTGHKDSL
ncbi:MAG: WD40 repeat domain-containing protein [Dolichospermum sp.]